MSKYVIIGNGVAAAACIEGIRRADTSGEITVVSEEKHPVYCRPLISYYLEGKTDTEKMKYRADDFYEKNGCRVLYGKKAVSADNGKKTVTLDDGGEIGYEKLCIAAGSTPFVPPFEGLDTVTEKFTFMSLDDALSLEKSLRPDARVLIVGAGLIGLKCAEGIKERVGSITVCDLAPRILSSILDDESAKTVQNHLEASGIEFMLSDSVEKFEKNTAFMKSGAKAEFDILVLAVGVRANTAVAKEMGAIVNRGIIVDERCQTSLENVYSAGDCTEGEDITLGEKRVLAILPNAYAQGFCAGANMAGAEKLFDKGLPVNSIGFFGLHIMTAGTYCDEAQGGSVSVVKTEKGIKKLFCRDDLLCGFIIIGETDRAGIYTSMIREKIPLSSVDFEQMKKMPTSAAFSQKKRGKMFGGVV